MFRFVSRATLSVVAVVASGCIDFRGNFSFADGGADGGQLVTDGGVGDGGCSCSAPEPSCSDGKTLVTARVRACSASLCQLESTSTTCATACSDGGCVGEPCAGKVCLTPPAPSCVTGTTLRVSNAVGVCSGGECTYGTTDLTCPSGCVNGVCAGDACAGKLCVTPPASECLSASSLRVYLSLGSCTAGACQYPSGDLSCANGCLNGACQGDACAGQACTTPPSATCVDLKIRRTFAATGTCDSDSGRCAYAPSDATCPGSCSNGECVTNACDQVTCTTPAPRCTSATQREVFQPGGCDAGQCVFPSKVETCEGEAQCADGGCVLPACRAATCTGCCQGDTCVVASDQTATSCGTGAAACLACASGYSCSAAGAGCVDVNECEPNGGRGDCDANATCTNLPGSHTCTCKSGYTGSGKACRAVGAVQWREVTPATGPSARKAAAMVFDSKRNRMVLFGGYANSPLGDTWVYDGDAWLKLSPATSPSARFAHAMAYDASRDRVVLFGGSNAADEFTETWEFDGTTWAKRTMSQPTGEQVYLAMTYDSARKRVVMAANNTDLTWEYDGQHWSTEANASTGVRLHAALAYDSAHGVSVLFGGNGTSAVEYHDTWLWSGSAWSNPTSSGPPGRTVASLAYDSSRGVVLMSGGYAGSSWLQDTWEWDGTAWAQRATTGVKPVGRASAAMAFDSKRGQVVLFGGDTSSVQVADTWEYGP